MSLSPISGSLGQQRAMHLLRRLTFGPDQQQVNTFADMNIQQALDALLGDFTMPEPPKYLKDPEGKLPPGYDWTTQVHQVGNPDINLRSLFCTGGWARCITTIQDLRSWFFSCIQSLLTYGEKGEIAVIFTGKMSFLGNTWSTTFPIRTPLLTDIRN